MIVFLNWNCEKKICWKWISSGIVKFLWNTLVSFDGDLVNNIIFCSIAFRIFIFLHFSEYHVLGYWDVLNVYIALDIWFIYLFVFLIFRRSSRDLKCVLMNQWILMGILLVVLTILTIVMFPANILNFIHYIFQIFLLRSLQ